MKSSIITSLSGLLTAGPSAANFGALTLFLLWFCVCVAYLHLNALCYLNKHHSSFLNPHLQLH